MNILTVATAWGSKHGGANVFNYRLCCSLKNLGHQVTCFVKEFDTDDQTNAIEKDIKLLQIKRPSKEKWTNDDLGHVKEDLTLYDIIILHDLISSVFIECIPEKYSKPIIASFIHTWYLDTDYLNLVPDEEINRKFNDQLSLINRSDIVFTSGEWLAKKLFEKKPTLKQFNKIRSFIPGRVVARPKQRQATGPIVTFGRLSLVDKDNKGGMSVLNAYMELIKINNRSQNRLDELPSLKIIGVEADKTAVIGMKEETQSLVGWRARVEFLPFEDYYDLEKSNTYKYLEEASIVVTPSRAETFGLTSLEASSLGIPLIASKHSGFSHQVTNMLGDIPETAIEWLEASDFTNDNLPNSLANLMKRICARYENYKNGAQILADRMQANWPTWDESARKMTSELSLAQLEKRDGCAQKSQLWAPNQPFANLVCPVNSSVEKEAGEGTCLTKQPCDKSDETSITNVNETCHSMPTLLELAKLSYHDNLEGSEALNNLIQDSFAGKRCTQLQRQIFNFFSDGLPHDYQDILLCGGTSSGKTTLAEIIFGRANNSDFTRSRIIYLAPTRALAQERWRDWRNKFASLPNTYWDENVIISTGEDHSGDRALARGEFLIACLVYEKANVILSRSSDLMKRLTMVVVDELHMVSDIHRGPIIETLLAKVKHEKHMRQNRDGIKLPLRIVCITTEPTAADDFKNYLTNIDCHTDKEIPPIIAIDNGRPCSVRHVLVLPKSDGKKSYRQVEVAVFPSNAPLRVDNNVLRKIAVDSDEARSSNLSHFTGLTDRNQEYQDKYSHFLTDWLKDNPFGKRILVFIGSKIQQVALADRMQAIIKNDRTLCERPILSDRIDGINDQIASEDTSIDKEILRRTVIRGVFIHNSDINKRLRFAIEEYLAKPLSPALASEIIIATETLSYGVNLSINDVTVLTLQFPESERNQEHGATPALLTLCDFSNMCGRAGRLNQANGNATVYIWPITDHGYSPKEIARMYYTQNEPVRSKLVHGDDKKAYTRILLRGCQDEAPRRLSYPFVRTVLDGLRFLGGAPGQTGATNRNDADFEEIEEEFIKHLLYSSENGRSEEDKKRVSECFKMTIIASKEQNFELVKPSNRGFKITALGASIIDTGTEIATLEPLKKSLEQLLTLIAPPDQIPVESLLLPILVQSEAHRQVLFLMPECKTEVSQTENRKELLRWIGNKFTNIGFTEPIINGLEKFLEGCDSDPHHASFQGELTPALAHDGCLRLFCGLLLWVSGHSISYINEELKQIGRITGKRTSLSLNVASFADRVSWKLLFLSDLMRFGSRSSDVRMLLTNARILNTRLRLGCTGTALPFLVTYKPLASPISRKLAHELVAKGATQKSICSGVFDLDSYTLTEQGSIKTQLRNFIIASFHQLRNEFGYGTPRVGAGEICQNYWLFAEGAIHKLIQGNKTIPLWPSSVVDEVVTVEAAPGYTDDDAPTIRFQWDSSGLFIIGRRIEWDGDRKVPRDAIKWHIQASTGGSPLHETPNDYTLIIIDFPWLLHAAPNECQRLRMSPAAFGVLITLIVRSFFKDTISALEALSEVNGSISTVSLIDLFYRERSINQLPDPLFDAWAGYLDAD